MSQRKKQFILLSILVGLLIVFLLVYLLLNKDGKDTTPPSVNPSEQTETSTVDNRAESEVTAPLPAGDIEREVVPGVADQGLVAKQTARIFVERFGTYSNQNNNEHLESIESIVTDSMWSWAQNQAQAQSLQDFNGSITNVIASTLSEFEENTATVTLQALEIKETADSTSTENKNGRVELVRQGNTWLVNALYWE